MNKYEFKLTPAYCLYNGTAVMEQHGSSIKFLTEKPYDESLKKSLSRAFYKFINFVIAQEDCPEEFRKLPDIQFFEGNRQQLRKWVSKLYANNQLENEKKDGSGKEIVFKDEAAAVVLLDSILNEARSKNATDIHIEENCVRFRIEGRLESEMQLEETRVKELVQRIKFLAGMNVLENRRSQDGHFVYGTNHPVFVRVSTMGIIGKNYSTDCESVVIRILDTKRIPLSVEKLGFNENQILKINELCREKNGLIIICGPTGAGKSTTACSMLLKIKEQKNGNVKIISLEDPPEYVIPGITQVQIDEKIKNSFSEALIHVFRQDPDVLMIGEIRDEKSASAAIRAALTGHLVVATLHTASASGAILRLEDLGILRNVVVSVLKGVICQEINHLNSRTNLLADVCIPEKNLYEMIKENLSEMEMESGFMHIQNYLDLNRDNFVGKKRKDDSFYGFEKTGRDERKALEG